MPLLALGEHFAPLSPPADRAAIVFANNQWLEASQLAGWADFQYNAVTPSASSGILIMAVIQFNPSALTSHPFCKGTRSNSAYAGYCLEVAPNAASMTWYISGGNSACGAVTMTGGVSTSQMYVISLAAKWVTANNAWTAVASLNGRTGNWVPGGTLAAAPAGQGGGAPPAALGTSVNQPGYGLVPPWNRCEGRAVMWGDARAVVEGASAFVTRQLPSHHSIGADEFANYYSNFKVFQYLIFQGQPTAAEQAQITSNWTTRFYMYCPNATAPYAPDSYTAVAAASPAGSCGYALGGDTCTLQCASGYTAVAGTAAMTCMRGAWAGHPLVCGGTCPALAAPVAAASCTRFLQARR